MKSHRLFTLLAVSGLLCGSGRADPDAHRVPRTIEPTQFASEADTSAWRHWSPRDEIAPRFSYDASGGRAGSGALKIATRASSNFGAWRRAYSDVRGGQDYRFTAWYRTDGIENDRRSVIARLQWLDSKGQPVKTSVRPPEYASDVAREKGWTKIETVLRAPGTAAGLDVQLSLGFVANGTVWWDEVALAETEPAPDRTVRVMTVNFRPKNTLSREASVAQFCDVVRDAASQRPDIICLPEGITVVGTRKTYVEVSEPVPGPTTRRLGALARELNSYIVAGLYEREGAVVYNTAVLIDRQGRVAGRYRKTHLPREEWEKGLTPGENYPVFETDFGRIGLMICWDLQFPEPWRALGLQGAELVLLPIWGGSEPLLQARAIENHTYLVSSGYDIKSCIVAPDGEILAEATRVTPAITTEIHLGRKIYQRWLGDMSTRTWKERRGDLPW